MNTLPLEINDIATDQPAPLATVLVVDDNENNVLVLSDALTFTGFNVLVANTGIEALQLAEKYRPACILLDIMLPDIDGYEVCGRLKSDPRLASIPIILVSALDANDNVIVGLDLGAEDYITKPFNLRIVEARVRAVLRTHEAQFELQQANKKLAAANELLADKTDRMADYCKTAHQFVDDTSHEFRTPLAVIKEYTAIMQEGLAGPINDEQSEYLAIVASRIDDLTRLIDDMLDTSKLEAGLLGVHRQQCSIQQIVQQVTTTIQRKALAENVTVDVSLEPDLPEVFCDPDKASRVATNLAINAIKFAGSDGRVTIWAKPSDDSSQVIVGISDDGPGIDEASLQVIFDRFTQLDNDLGGSRPQGFGLGLNIAQELAALNLGQLSVESQAGQGSTFSFAIPKSDPSNVLQHYLSHGLHLSGNDQPWSLLTAAVTNDCDDEWKEALGEMFHHELRGSDLIMEVAKGNWLIVLHATANVAEAIGQRLQDAREKANRNRPQGELPEFSLQIQGTWTIPDQREDLEAEFQHQLFHLEQEGE